MCVTDVVMSTAGEAGKETSQGEGEHGCYQLRRAGTIMHAVFSPFLCV